MTKKKRLEAQRSNVVCRYSWIGNQILGVHFEVYQRDCAKDSKLCVCALFLFVCRGVSRDN